MSFSTKKEREEWANKSDEEFYSMFNRYLKILKEDIEENKLDKYLSEKIGEDNR